MKIKNILSLVALILFTQTSAQEYALALPAELAQLFTQARACAQQGSECSKIIVCSDLLAKEKALDPKDLIEALEEVYVIAQTQEIAGLEELSTKLVLWLESIIDELIKDSNFAQDLATFDFNEEESDDQDEAVTRGKKKNKTFKNLCVQRNVNIGGNLCVAGKALFKNGLAFGTSDALTITAPLNVTTVTGSNATFANASVGTVTFKTLHGIVGTNSSANINQVYYDPATGILFYIMA